MPSISSKRSRAGRLVDLRLETLAKLGDEPARDWCIGAKELLAWVVGLATGVRRLVMGVTGL
jgi:hypothetical protein